MRTFHTGGASDKTKKEVIKTRSGGKETRAERTINYDITQGLTGVTDLLEARIGMSQKDKVAVIAFWPGKVDIREVESKSGAKKFEVRVVPQGDKALAEAKEIAKSYTFSRTASKTFKKLDPELPITIVSDESELLVIDGEEVQRGDFIKNGTPIPQEVLATKSVNEAAKEIINGVQAIYGAQDVALHDKHLEVIVRQMLSKVTIVDSGDTDLMPGAQMDRRTYMRINKEARDEGKKTASARDEVLGMTRASLAAESWLSAASFQETTRVLTQAALDRSTDKLKGLKENVIIGKLIPAGTGLAAYRQIDAVPTEEAKAERYPNIPWATTSDESIDFKDDSFSGAGLSFTSLEDYSNEEPAQ
jgi:DNA-directed RNA polymerase subunit beta'